MTTKKVKPGQIVLYKRTGETAIVVEQKMKNQVTIVLNKNSQAYNTDFKYLDLIGKVKTERLQDQTEHVTIEVTVSVDEVVVLPDEHLAKLLYS